MPKRKTVATKVGNGTGYAGDAQRDAAKRKQLKKKAVKNESKTMKTQQTTLTSFVQSLQSSNCPPPKPSSELLNLIKSVLRNQADWSSTSTETSIALYQSALDCCDGIVAKFPKLLGKQDDEESLLVALFEMVSTAEIVSKHSGDYSTSVQTIATRVMQLKPRAVQASKRALVEDDLLVVDNHAIYRQILRPLAFDFVHDLAGHAFAKNKSSSSSMSASQRKVILKELSTYQTALPIENGSSVFIRAMEGRMDLLRCLIIGPDESPYACGLFFFDIHLGNYPTNPPMVKFLTTGGGKYRMNPNLYQDGKVCLSLLGTWSGPGWQAGESTLLQVLVSIQSLILVQEPYFNEPGWQSMEGTEKGRHESQKYNANIRKYTMDAAILPHLRQMGGQMDDSSSLLYPEFLDIADKHFSLKERTWKKQLSEWRKEASQKANESQGKKKTPYPNNNGRQVTLDMDSLYISCLDAWERRPRKSAKRNGDSHSNNNNSSTTRASLHLHQPLSAVEVNGVIEIDLESDDDEGLNTGTKPLATITESAVVGKDSNTNHACTKSDDVIDLT